MKHSELLALVAAASNGRTLNKPSGGWDTLSAFAASLEMAFPGECRENILRLAAVTAASGKFNGQGARWGSSYKFAPAWREYITGAITTEGTKARREQAAQFRSVARLFAALGGTDFDPAE